MFLLVFHRTVVEISQDVTPFLSLENNKTMHIGYLLNTFLIDLELIRQKTVRSFL